MFIKCLVENTYGGLAPAHGLCFYIETINHKILFDLGPDDLFYKNANEAGIDISKVDIAIISHGHNDHGGGLKTFLEHNKTAKVFIQDSAFEKHYSNSSSNLVDIGLDANLKNHPQIKLINGDYIIDDELSVYTAFCDILPSPMNTSLLNKNLEKDNFNHEHSLLIKEDKNVLFTGCSHNGVFNILNTIEEQVDVLIGGFHLYSNSSNKTAPVEFLNDFKNKLNKCSCTFYTCHCTGIEAYSFLKSENIKYISCGMELNI